ncbi:hypothetical protein MM236_16295 [Belliella sp. DSM 107340]|uniref:SdpI/YhfL protein family protein n=1 Tax=Belliella calami TaxID=2923436 RepID=A0ABS9UTQ2_9BACT|nr:hypothetical protein [Belliella calami]MCH7399565.1 hypothetical protein [Belliella calami]
MLAVVFMATGINYSLFKYLKAFPSEKSNLYYMNPFNQFEKTVKIAKPLRMIGLVFFMFQMILWLDIIEFEYDRYVFFLVIVPLLSYIFLAINFYNSRQKSED